MRVYFFLLTMGLVLFGLYCREDSNKPAKGILEFSYEFTKPADFEPSYQLSIWLEKENGEYYKTLFVTDYLSYGGYNDSTICPAWSENANWDHALPEIFDAVTKATPPVGQNQLQIDCQDFKILPGLYQYKLQVHLVDTYNILAQGKINIGKKANESTALMLHEPQQHTTGTNTIQNVVVKYIM